jgi:predicted Zn-dependent protease
LKRIFSIVVAAIVLGATVPFIGAAELGDLKTGEAQLEAWNVAAAEETAAGLRRRGVKSAPLFDFAARVQFNLGRYEEALKLMEEALAIDSANPRRQAFRILLQRTRDTVGKFKRFESAHFVLYLDDARDAILAPSALTALEKSYQAIAETLGYRPEGKVRVEIAPDAPSFNAISTLSLRDIEETGAVGICKFNKIMAISPRALSRGYRWLDSLNHEYVHYAITHLTNNKAPIWIHEGLARFLETRWRRDETARAAADYLTPINRTLLARALGDNKFVGFKKMEPSLIHLETAEEVQLAYAEAASAIDLIVTRRGQTGLRELLKELRERSAAEAVEKILGVGFAAFENHWKDFLKGKEFKEIEGSRPRRFKVRGETGEDDGAVELREIQSAVARNRTGLGDRMRDRGRTAAAAMEYERALQASPHSPIILTKLARALIETKRHEEAVGRLREAEGLDPDSAAVYVLLGRAHHASKDHAAARKALEEAIHINPFDPGIYRLLADSYDALGERRLAEQARATLARLGRR